MILPRNFKSAATALTTLTFGLWFTKAQATAVPLIGAALTNTTVNETGTGWDFTWNSIKPSEGIVWSSCYDTFECAKLEVPLDYLGNDKSAGTAAIAIIKYPSAPRFPEYSEKWGGPVLINPGGPGGSGVDIVLRTGEGLQSVIGEQYSIIGFDPRGVNNTLPPAECFDSDVDRIVWAIRSGMGVAGDVPELVAESYVRNKHLGQVCTGDPKRRKVLKYFGTANVARDMLEINERIWDLAKSGVHRKGLQYWGFSYGSVLGITFATLYPKKVERMVLDGIVDVHDWFSLKLEKNLNDVEAVLDSFYTFCSQAGPLQCFFHTGTKPAHIRARAQSLFAALRKQPLGYAISLSTGIPSSQLEIFTYNDLRNLVFQATYSPLDGFPPISALFNELEKAIKSESGVLPLDMSGLKLPMVCNKDEESFRGEYLRQGEAGWANMCSDGVPITNRTLSEHHERIRILKEQSPSFGDIWAMGTLSCIGWNIQANWKAKYPTTDRSKQGSGPEGAAPILFIGNTADPATPLANAYSMAKLFPKGGAFVAVQEGEGHCSISVPSTCMSSQIKSYFATGKVAKSEEERYCGRQVAPFIGEVSPKDKRDANEGDDHKGRDAMRKVGKAVYQQMAHPGSLSTGGSGFGNFLYSMAK